MTYKLGVVMHFAYTYSSPKLNYSQEQSTKRSKIFQKQTIVRIPYTSPRDIHNFITNQKLKTHTLKHGTCSQVLEKH